MSVYPPPLNINSIFNYEDFPNQDDTLNQRTADLRYLIKTGADTDVGPLTCSNQITATYFNSSTDGTALAPAFVRNGGSGLGMYFGANQINWSVVGVKRLDLTNSKLTTTVPFVVPAGTSSNCSIQATGAANTGIVIPTNQVNLIVSGSQVANWTAAYFTTSLPIKAPNGTAIACAYQFSSEQGMGLFYEAANNLGIAIGGTQYYRLTNLGLTFVNSGITGASPTPLNYFEEYSYSTTFGFVGFNQTISYTLKITRLGNRVFLYVPSWSAGVTNNSGGSALCITATAMASRFYPPNGVSMIGFGYLSGTANLVWIFVNSVGNILIYKGVGVSNSTWLNGEACRIEGFCLDWTIN